MLLIDSGLSEISDKTHARRGYAEVVKAAGALLKADIHALKGLSEKETAAVLDGISAGREGTLDPEKVLEDARKLKKSAGARIRGLIAYQALEMIAEFYKLEKQYKDETPEDRVRLRQENILPLVEAYFAWVKEVIAKELVPPESKTGKALAYSLNSETQLKVFLSNGLVPISNGATERIIRPIAVGRRNWNHRYTVRGAESMAAYFTLIESAKLNGLVPYEYLEYLLETIPTRRREDGVIYPADLEDLLPWSDTLPEVCFQPEPLPPGAVREEITVDAETKAAHEEEAVRQAVKR